MRSTLAGLQVRGHPANVLDRDAVVHVLVAAQPIDDRHVRADRVAYCAHDFQRKPHAAREIAPVFVVALVAMGREELAQQIPVRTVNADEVAARLTGADRGIGEALDDLGDLVATQGARDDPPAPAYGTTEGARDCRPLTAGFTTRPP